MDTSNSNNSKAIIFDMDGVLVDNHAYHVMAWKEFCKQHNKHLNKEEFDQQVNGHTVQAVIRYLFGSQLSAKEVEELSEQKESLYRSHYQPHMEAVAGLKPFLEELQHQGWQLAVATSAPTRNMHFVLNGLNIADFFPTCIDSSGVAQGKPAPDIYLKAARALGLTPARCIVFEDSIAGITAGQKAGMHVIALATTHNKEELHPTGVRWIYDSFNDIDVKQLNEILHES